MSTLALLLKESWSHVEDAADDMANNFYARIFRAHPDIRELFPTEMTTQRSGLLSALVSIIQTIDDPERFDAILRRLGRDHRRFLVTPEHYGIVGGALLDSLREYAGPRWSIEYDQAWRDAYDAMATKMIIGADYDSPAPAYWHADVVGHERRARDIAVITCRPMTPFTFQAGQYVAIECPYHPRQWRTYSIANAPRSDGTIEFHVRAPSAGWVSAALVRRLQVDDVLRISEPMGSMTLNRLSDRDVVCVAGGTGLAPIKSLVEELASCNRARWTHVFMGARDSADLYDLAAVSDLAARYPWLSAVAVCSEDPAYRGEQGDVNEAVERFGPWPDHDFYLSGSPAMVRATLGSLARMGVAPARISYDAITNSF